MIVAASGPSLSSGGLREHRGGRRAPHPGAPLLALFGEEQGVRGDIGAVVVDRFEQETCLTAAGLHRQLRIVEQPAALHEVHHERRVAELEEQVLAPPANHHQFVAVRVVGPGECGLEGGEVERHEFRQGSPAVPIGEPFGVRLDLWHLGHRRTAIAYS